MFQFEEIMDQRKIATLLACGLLCTFHTAYTEEKKEQKEASVEVKKLDKKDVSYALGYNIGEVLHRTDEKLVPEEIAKGISDAFTKSTTPRFKEEEIKNILMNYNVEVSNAMREKQEKTRLDNIQKGKDFVAGYEKKPGIKKDESGILYRVMQEGKGALPTAKDKVTVDYVGKKIDGTVFFSTKEHGMPADFVVENLIKGLVVALQKMPVGSKWEVVLPPEMAYGDMGAPEAVAPGETLIFEIELKEIKKNEKAADDESEEDSFEG